MDLGVQTPHWINQQLQIKNLMTQKKKLFVHQEELSGEWWEGAVKNDFLNGTVIEVDGGLTI